MTDNNDQDFPKGCQVCIKDLQSERGNKLNGSYGIVLDIPDLIDGLLRYPIMIYASRHSDTGELDVLPAPIKRGIKGEHLELLNSKSNNEGQFRSDALLEKAASRYWQDAFHESGSEQDDNVYFWLQQYHKCRPEDFVMGSLYAKLLRDNEPERAKEALEILTKYIPFYPSDHATFHNFCSDYCEAACMVGGYLEEALELAEKSGLESCLDRLQRACTNFIDEDPNFENSFISDIQIRACKKLLELSPTDAENMMSMAAAYCLANNHLEGAKWYRRVLATDDLTEEGRALTNRYLCIAQLKCPGQPLEEKIIIGFTQGGVSAINVKDKSKIVKDSSMYRETGEIQFKVKEDVTIFDVPLPVDPDDSEVFPPSLLRQISPQ